MGVGERERERERKRKDVIDRNNKQVVYIGNMGICQCVFRRRRRYYQIQMQKDAIELGEYIIQNNPEANEHCLCILERIPNIRNICVHNRTTGQKESLLSHLIIESINYLPSNNREKVIMALINRLDCDPVPPIPHAIAPVGVDVFVKNSSPIFVRNSIDAYSYPFFRVLLRLSNSHQQGTMIDIHRNRLFFTNVLQKMFGHPTVKEYVFYLMKSANYPGKQKRFGSHLHYNYDCNYNYPGDYHYPGEMSNIASEHFRMIIYLESIQPWVRTTIDAIIREHSTSTQCLAVSSNPNDDIPLVIPSYI